MSAHCHHDHHGHSHDHGTAHPPPPAYRRVLWVALGVNLLMFGLEIASGIASGSASLLADAIDFLGDAANYGLTLAVLGLSVAWRARAAMFKAASMGLFGLLVLGRVLWGIRTGTVPQASTMGLVGALALAANLGVAWLLYAYREGDANMRGVWLCTRNDAIGNVAVMLAALGVFGTGSHWPDLLVAALMAGLALAACLSVLRQARRELASGRAAGA